MTTLPLPGFGSNFVNAAQGVVSDERAILFAEVGAGGTAAVETLILVTGEAQGRTLLGASQGSEAIGYWFAQQQLRSTVELYVYTLDAAGFLANTWTITHGGTTTSSGTDIWRLGSHTVIVSHGKDADADAQRDAFVAAVTAAGIPFTVAAGIATGESTITSVHLGVSAGRTPITLNQYPQRAEIGVPGATPATLSNNADATGVPAVLLQADFDKLRTITSQYWIGNVALGAWLDGIDNALRPGWQDLNQYTWYVQSYATPDDPTPATFTGLISARNNQHMSVFAQENAPHYELGNGVRLLDTVIGARATDGRSNPGLVQETIRGMSPGTFLYEPAGKKTGPIIAVDGMSHYASGGVAICPVFVTMRSKTNLAATDFTETMVSAVLARRRILEAVGDVERLRTGDLFVPDGQPLGKKNISLQSMRDEITVVLKALAAAGQIFATEAEAAALIESVLPIVTGNIVTGIKTIYNGQVVQPTLRHEATLQAT